MSRTKKTAVARVGRAAVIGATGLASVALAAVPASAKGNVDITAPRTARVGTAFTVAAHGGDDAARYLRVCLEGREDGAAWHGLNCGAVTETGADARVTARVRATHAGVPEYRAVVYGLTGPHDRHPVRERTSDPVAVHVR
ncbi:hypothetical protein AB0P12_16255 [Streptomyces subrutilus]|uniref:hypothetical protein n=1 Tax=Streptomyces subrutilus TaxID=36818 RepID=UPI00340CCE1A